MASAAAALTPENGLTGGRITGRDGLDGGRGQRADVRHNLPELVFGERSSVVVDPSEEKIKAEFNEVKRTYLPLHSVLRIDEVKKQGVSKVVALEGSNVAQFPMPIYTPGGDSNTRK